MTNTPAPHDEREALEEIIGASLEFSSSEVVEGIAQDLIVAGYRKPTVQPTARPTTEGGVWGSYVAYLEALESRVQPTVEELERTIYDKIAFQGGDDEHFESVRGYIYHDAARAVHALFTSAPTVADVREQVAREIRALKGGINTANNTLRDEVLEYAARTAEGPARVARGGE